VKICLSLFEHARRRARGDQLGKKANAVWKLLTVGGFGLCCVEDVVILACNLGDHDGTYRILLAVGAEIVFTAIRALWGNAREGREGLFCILR
jgi:hypothetical protein